MFACWQHHIRTASLASEPNPMYGYLIRQIRVTQPIKQPYMKPHPFLPSSSLSFHPDPWTLPSPSLPSPPLPSRAVLPLALILSLLAGSKQCCFQTRINASFKLESTMELQLQHSVFLSKCLCKLGCKLARMRHLRLSDPERHQDNLSVKELFGPIPTC